MQSRNALLGFALAILVVVLPAAAVRDARIVAVARNEEILALKGEDAEVLDPTQSLAGIRLSASVTASTCRSSPTRACGS
jgi:hypothetical protein